MPDVLAIGEALIDLIDEGAATALGAHESGSADYRGADTADEGGEGPTEIPGGSPANVALTVARLGHRVDLETWIGDDARGRAILSNLADSGVRVTASSIGADRTSVATAIVDDLGQATYRFDLDWSPVGPLPVPAGTRVVHVGSIAAVLDPGRAIVFDAVRRARGRALVTVDPNVRPSIVGSRQDYMAWIGPVLACADVIKVSDEDLDWMRGASSRAAVIHGWLADGVSLVVLTGGRDGARAWALSGAEVHVPATPVDVVDTVGAGDSFMGGLIDALVRGDWDASALAGIGVDDLEGLVRRGCEVADVTVSREGANPPWLHEIGGVSADGTALPAGLAAQ